MSIKSMCVGDTVTLQIQTVTSGDAFGDAISWSDVPGQVDVICRINNPSASEHKAYQAIGESYTHRVFFSSDIGILGRGPKYRLKWTKTSGNKVDVSPVRYLEVGSYEKESSPSGALLLWIANCNEQTIGPAS